MYPFEQKKVRLGKSKEEAEEKSFKFSWKKTLERKVNERKWRSVEAKKREKKHEVEGRRERIKYYK